MNLIFYSAGLVALVATLLVIVQRNAVHALLYLIVSLLAVALIFFSLGAAFVAALEVIIYAGAIMVLFVFVVMMLNLGTPAARAENQGLDAAGWWGPGVLVLILLAELIYAVLQGTGRAGSAGPVGPQQVGAALYGPYLLGVELSSLLLLAGLVGAYHLGRRSRTES